MRGAGSRQRLGEFQHSVLSRCPDFYHLRSGNSFIFPVAAVFRRWIENGQGLFAFVEILIFVGILFLGLIYAWAKGDLEWVKKVKV